MMSVNLQNETSKNATKEDVGEENVAFVEEIHISRCCRLVEEESQAGRQERTKT